MPYLPALVTLFALGMYFMFALNVAKARGRYGVKAPVTSGNIDFERYYRVQMNTLEMMIIFLPALWIFALSWPAPLAASVLGIVWIIGRILYAIGYYKEAEKRFPGFALSMTALSLLLLGGLAGVVTHLVV